MAVEVALFEDIFVELEFVEKVFICVLGIVMGDDPLFDLGIFAENGCIGNR